VITSSITTLIFTRPTKEVRGQMLEAEDSSSSPRPRTILASRPACPRGLNITGNTSILVKLQSTKTSNTVSNEHTHTTIADESVLAEQTEKNKHTQRNIAIALLHKATL